MTVAARDLAVLRSWAEAQAERPATPALEQRLWRQIATEVDGYLTGDAPGDPVPAQDEALFDTPPGGVLTVPPPGPEIDTLGADGSSVPSAGSASRGTPKKISRVR